MMDRKSYRNSIIEFGRNATGKMHLLNYMDGKRITQRQAILSRCYDCMAFYQDGRIDCEVETCPLYPYMPYRKDKKFVAPDPNKPDNE